MAHYLCMKFYLYFAVSLAYQNHISTLHFQNPAPGPDLQIDCHPSSSALLLKATIAHMILVLPFCLILSAPAQSQGFITSHWIEKASVLHSQENQSVLLDSQWAQRVKEWLDRVIQIQPPGRQQWSFWSPKSATLPRAIHGKWSRTCPKIKPRQR